jgi:hypothetical protein
MTKTGLCCLISGSHRSQCSGSASAFHIVMLGTLMASRPVLATASALRHPSKQKKSGSSDSSSRPRRSG